MTGPNDTAGGKRPQGGGKQSQGGGKKRGGKRGDAGSSRAGRVAEEQEAIRLRNKLSTVLRRLPDIERQVLEARMGLVDGTPMKPGQVAERLGLTIHEVKKIEARAFDRIREIGPLKGLERFLGK